MATAGEFRLAADIGTGGGAIALALAHSVPRLQVHAVDTSAAALEVARRNGHRLGLSQQLTFHRGNLLEPLERKPDLVVANLPYVATELLDTLPAPVRYEPRGALDGGADGLGL